MSLTDWAEKEGHTLSVKGGSLLIENEEAINFSDAKGQNQVYLLRWRYRKCRICATNFDISEGGFAYTCAACQKTEVPL